MRSSLLAASLLALPAFSTLPAAAAAGPCASPQTQLAMNACAASSAKAAAAKLAAALAKLEKALPEQHAAIAKSQSAYLAYRTAACAVSTQQVAGGSMLPAVLSDCEETLDTQRFQTLVTQMPQDR